MKWAIIVGPPWSRSGTARILRSQIEYYRARGYATLFLCVPVKDWMVEGHPVWEDFKDGIRALGADRTFFAEVNPRRFAAKTFAADVRSAFQGTTLDWMAFTAKTSLLPDAARRAVRDLPVELIHANYAFTLGFAQVLARRIARPGRRMPLIVETHDVSTHQLETERKVSPLTRRLDDPKMMLRSELALLGAAEVLVHCSAEDMRFLQSRLPRKRHVLTLPSIDDAFIGRAAAGGPSRGPVDLMYVGSGTEPNGAALKWFFERVWPLIADRGYSIQILGGVGRLARRRLPEIHRAFAPCFFDSLPDLAASYRAARCLINPAVSGTGIAIKTIEALAAGKPFVGTSKAYRGMPMKRIERTGLRAHDTPRGFAGAIVRALFQERSAAAASRAAYDDLFSKRAAFSSRDEALRLAVDPGKSKVDSDRR
jgi:hypothetical protein